MEAGLGTLSRMDEGQVDLILVLAIPTPKSLEVARRAVEMAQERKVGPVLVLANRISKPEDLALVRQTLPNQEIMVIPDDMAIENADRDARALVDAAPDSPAMQAFRAIVDRLLQTISTRSISI